MELTSEGLLRLIQAYRASDSLMFEGRDDNAAMVVREGFAQAFLRFWELQVESWHGPQACYSVENPDPNSDERMLPYFEHPDIRILKMVVAVIHGESGAELYENLASVFSSSIEHYREEFRVPPYRQLLRLRQSDMERFVTALSESRPSRGFDDLGPWHHNNQPPF